MKVFLGGTCNGSEWRDRLIPTLECDFFNPVVEDWTPECMEEEIKQREECDICLYVLTPKMTGAYAVAEVVDDSNKRPYKTVLCVLLSDGEDYFTEHQMKSMDQVMKMVIGNNAVVFNHLSEVTKYLNRVHANV